MAEVVSIHRVGAKNGPAESLREAQVHTNFGIVGDWRSRASTTRQITLIEEEALLATAQRLGHDIPPGASRRQVVVRGMPLNSTVGKVIHVGDLELEVTGLCDPCDNMERTIGPGGRAALGNRGGICARVMRGGTLRVGDSAQTAELRSASLAAQSAR